MKPSRYWPWFLWLVAVSFFAFQFVLRILPGLIMPQIMAKFHVDASSYGLLSSMYYIGYAGAQLPVAFCLDRFGPRRVISACVFICSLSTFAIAHSTAWSALLAGRFLMGVGSAAGFLGTAKVISQWFKTEHFARMLGVTFTFGLMGALYGGKPVALWIDHSGWEDVMNVLAFAGLGLSCVAMGFLKTNGPFTPLTEDQKPPKVSDLRVLFSNPNLILLGVSNLLMVGTLEGFADVWGVTYLVKTFELPKENAAFLSSMIFVGMLFGGPLLAFLAEKSKRVFEVTAAAGFLSAALMLGLLLFFKTHHELGLTVLFFAIGVLCCYQVLVLSIGSKLAPSHLVGITTAFLNCINMLGGAFFHGMIGMLLDWGWTQELQEGMRVYSVDNFKTALLVIPVASLIGALGVMMAKGRMLKAGAL